MKIIDGMLKLFVWWAGEEWSPDCTRWQVTLLVVRWLIKSITLFLALCLLWLFVKFGLLEALALFVSFVSTKA